MKTAGIHLLLNSLLFAVSLSAVPKRDSETKQPPVSSFIPCLGDVAPASPALPPPTAPVSYTVVFDAGSSGTKLKIYRVSRSDESLGLPSISLIYNKKFEPGIDTFLGDKEGLRSYLTTALTEVNQIVPEKFLADASLYLLATAGFRFLHSADSVKLMTDITDVFDNYTTKNFNGRKSIGILSGEEEGVYSWVALNYLLGKFAKKRPDNETVGLLEIGGGSTQIAFLPHSPLYDGEFQITISGRSYDLYAHSYLLFGINAINDWVVEALTADSKGNSTYGDPCMLKGDTKDVQTQEELTVTLYGTSEPERCLEILKSILKPETGLRCEPKPCAIGNVYQPSVDQTQFYATQGFTYAPVALNAVGPDQVLNIDLLEQNAFEHCRKNLTEAVEAGLDASVASTNCLLGIYMPTLFNSSYGFPRDTRNIKVTSKIGDQTIEWSLGVIIADLDSNRVTRKRR